MSKSTAHNLIYNAVFMTLQELIPSLTVAQRNAIATSIALKLRNLVKKERDE